MTLAAGAAEVDITPEPGVELMGYGARIGTSTGVHDRLHARALYLESRGSNHDQDRILLLSADVCLIAPRQADEIRGCIGEATGIPPGHILMGCTHTHSGPDTGLAALTGGRPLPEAAAALMEGTVAAALEAVSEARPAQLRWSRAEAAIGRNRRLADGPVDARVLVLRVDDQRTGRPLAVLFHHACHGTVLGHDNLLISADWPGVAARAISEQTGAVALFLLGAHADIDPRTRGLMDLAIPGQSIGAGFEAVSVLGLEVAEAVLGALDAGEPQSGARPLTAASARVPLPLHLGDCSPEHARRELEARKRELADLFEWPLESFPRLSDLAAAAQRSTRTLLPTEARRRISRARLYLRDKTAPFFVGGRRQLDVEVQVLRIGDAALLGLPLEPTTNVGLDWQARATRRLPLAAVAGIANGWLRYLPHPDDLAHPRADEHYEVLMSTFAPGACERLLQEGEELLAAIC